MKREIKNRGTRGRVVIPLILVLMVIGSMLVGAGGQTDSTDTRMKVQRGLVYRNDTLPVYHIPEVNIYDPSRYQYLWMKRRYRRLIRNVKRAYPYAKIANHRLMVLDRKLAEMDSRQERKKYIKEAEKEIMREFEKDIRKLTIRQGIILVKLIDRETGNTSYEIIKDIRGGLTAFFWQGIARIFGNNLKTEYDPDGEDKVLEDIVQAIEAGFI